MELFKGIFTIWEMQAARFWDQALRNPLVLETLGHNLRFWLGVQSASRGTWQETWRAWGLPTRRDQEMALYRLNQLAAQIEEISRRIDRLSKG